MSVRAKFKVTRIEASQTSRYGLGADGKPDPLKATIVELRTLVLSPVYSSDPESENRKFWEASPSGEIKLGTVNPAAWEAFELGGEYYVDFTPA